MRMSHINIAGAADGGWLRHQRLPSRTVRSLDFEDGLRPVQAGRKPKPKAPKQMIVHVVERVHR
jgi:hypothetical protein